MKPSTTSEIRKKEGTMTPTKIPAGVCRWSEIWLCSCAGVGLSGNPDGGATATNLAAGVAPILEESSELAAWQMSQEFVPGATATNLISGGYGAGWLLPVADAEIG